MGFFSNMGLFEKVAFIVTLPFTATAAVAVVAYEEVTGNKVFSDSNNSNTENEQATRERVERQAKEKRAEEERTAITSYATSGLITLQKMHSSAEQPVRTSFNFTQLRKAIQDNQQPVEILTHLLPNASESDAASTAQKMTCLLNEEIQKLKKLRKTIIDIKTSEVNS